MKESNILRLYLWKCGMTVWKIFAAPFMYVYIGRRREHEQYSSRQLPQEDYGTSWNKRGKGREGYTREKRERERERLHGFLWAKNWNNGNWLTSNEYSIGLPTLEQGNERKILEELHWCALIRQDNEKCVRNLRHTTLSYSLGGSHRNGW